MDNVSGVDNKLDLQSKLSSFKNEIIKNLKSFIKNPLKNKYLLIEIVLIMIIIFSSSVIAANNFINPISNNEEVEIEITPSFTPTITQSPTPTIGIKQKFIPSNTPTPVTGTVIFKYLKVNTNDLLTKVDTEVRVSGPSSVSNKGTTSIYSFANLTPGRYQVTGSTPAGYSLKTMSCSGSCRLFSNESNCAKEFDLAAGQTIELYCGYSGGDESSSSDSTTSTGKPEFTITYPTSGQTITFTSPSQTLCVVSVPVANTSGAIISYNLNGTGWQTGYCFLPPEGNNTVEIKIKNSSNIESDAKSVSFTFVKDY